MSDLGRRNFIGFCRGSVSVSAAFISAFAEEVSV